jgi:hypothetical protein
MRYMMTHAPVEFAQQLKNPHAADRIGAYARHVADNTGAWALPHKILNLTLRPFMAADAVGSKALKMLGTSQAEADRLMVLGVPTTWGGQKLLDMIESNMAARMFLKFSRVRISSLERGAEFTPGLHLINTRSRGIPERVGGPFRPQERLTKSQRRIRAEYGGLAMAAGVAYGAWRDPGTQETALIAAGAGPAAVPFSMGVAGGKAISRGKEPLTNMAIQLVQGLPGITEVDIRGIPNRLNPLHSGRTFISRLFGNAE